MRLVKLWARAEGINDSSRGTFNSYALTLMVSKFTASASIPRTATTIMSIDDLPDMLELLSTSVLLCSRNSCKLRPVRSTCQPVCCAWQSTVSTVGCHLQVVFHLQRQQPPILPPLHQLFQQQPTDIQRHPSDAGQQAKQDDMQVIPGAQPSPKQRHVMRLDGYVGPLV